MALLGHNYIYEEFLKEQLKQLEKSSEPHAKKEEKKNFLQKVLKAFQDFKKVIMGKK